MARRDVSGYKMLEDLRRNRPSGGADAFTHWSKAISEFTARRKQSLIDLAVDAANLAILIEQNPSLLSDPLVAAAIRDTNPSFDFSDPPTGEALQGAVNAAKGKYFEYLVVERLNNHERVGDVVLPDGYTAKLAESMTQPGWDLQILDSDNHVASYLQLKATDDAAYIKEALDRYPDITILATDEVADTSDYVLDADVSDEWLESTVRDAMGATEASFGEAFLDAFSPLLSLAFIVGTEGYRVAVSKKDINEAVLAVSHRGTRSLVSQSIGAMVYAAGGGLLALPAAVLTGLVYERLAELYEASCLIEGSRHQLLALRLQQQDIQLRG